MDGGAALAEGDGALGARPGSAPVVSAAALLREVPHPGEEEVRAALEPHLCRCGSHNRIIRAVLRAAAEA